MEAFSMVMEGYLACRNFLCGRMEAVVGLPVVDSMEAQKLEGCVYARFLNNEIYTRPTDRSIQRYTGGYRQSAQRFNVAGKSQAVYSITYLRGIEQVYCGN